MRPGTAATRRRWRARDDQPPRPALPGRRRLGRRRAPGAPLHPERPPRGRGGGRGPRHRLRRRLAGGPGAGLRRRLLRRRRHLPPLPPRRRPRLRRHRRPTSGPASATRPELRDGIERLATFALVFMAAANLAILSNHLLAAWILRGGHHPGGRPDDQFRGTAIRVRASWRYFLFSSVGLAPEPRWASPASPAAWRAPAATRRPSSSTASPRRRGCRRTPGAASASSLLLLGYGTKLGLAPMYTWLPETYDEAPPVGDRAARRGAVQRGAGGGCCACSRSSARASGRLVGPTARDSGPRLDGRLAPSASSPPGTT